MRDLDHETSKAKERDNGSWQRCEEHDDHCHLAEICR